MKANVDEATCCGCGPCEDICPEVFLIENGIARVKTNPVPPASEAKCREAKDSCPTEAISLDE